MSTRQKILKAKRRRKDYEKKKNILKPFLQKKTNYGKNPPLLFTARRKHRVKPDLVIPKEDVEKKWYHYIYFSLLFIGVFIRNLFKRK